MSNPLAPRRLTHVFVAAGAALLLTACATGTRPTLIEDPVVSDPSTQPVLDRLGRAGTTSFTATYDITPPQVGRTPVTATVVQDGLRRRVLIGDIDFIVDGTSSQTCFDAGVTCEPGINEGRISDLGITSEFWGTSLATKLRIDAARSIAPSSGSTTTIADWPAVCVDVSVPALQGAGTISYCALDAGLLGRYRGPNVAIELTSFSASADPTLLS
jgi:hypothetical protein